jgi:ankyrin repeat protein
MTALMNVSLVGDAETVRLLLSRGARISVKDKDGHTALWWARSNKAVVALLRRSAARQRK